MFSERLEIDPNDRRGVGNRAAVRTSWLQAHQIIVSAATGFVSASLLCPALSLQGGSCDDVTWEHIRYLSPALERRAHDGGEMHGVLNSFC
ncbi:protein of unknown function [Hyphomicrobium sp. MC1]|nr:protein of unknown function [Hyphomicrobium sp. MC1]